MVKDSIIPDKTFYGFRSSVNLARGEPNLFKRYSTVVKTSMGDEDSIIIDRDIVCTEFAPDIFAHLRYLDGYTDNDILKESLAPELEANI